MSKAYLVLENGKVFEGRSFGYQGEVIAEVVFSTAMTGYLETLTDKSYFGQIVAQTFPSIGNYGYIPSDLEGEMVAPSAYIVKEWCQVPSNFRSEGDLDTFFKEKKVVGLCGIDTRTLTKVLRENGTMNGAIVTDPAHADLDAIRAYKVSKAVASVTTDEIVTKGEGKYKVAVMDYGVKNSICEELMSRDAQVLICPAHTTAETLKELDVDGIVLSNGPGDPTEDASLAENLKEIMKLGKPIFGLGLGHQLFALANGFKTIKHKFGHRGANQPVKYTKTGRVYITSQNHGYTVDPASIDENIADGCFVNVNDKCCEGIEYKNYPACTVQFYPTSGGGTCSTSWLYDRFFEKMSK